MAFSSPDELDEFIGSVIAKLKAEREDDAAGLLAAPHRAAFTTGPEWLGEIGVAVRRVQATCIISEETNTLLERIMEAVHDIWPEM